MSLLEGPIFALENWFVQDDPSRLIARLLRESQAAGDQITAKLCAQALNGNEKAWKKCVDKLKGGIFDD